MTYVVNPNDPTTPLNNQSARQGAEELRDLKGLVATLVAATGKQSTVKRQVVLTGPVDTSIPPVPNMLQAGTGLALNLRTGTTAALLSFAQGYNVTTGTVDAYTNLQADTDGVLTLPANNTSFVMADYATTGTVTWGQTLIPPQINYFFDKTKQSILNFQGTNGQTTTTDDFGNTWTANGNAQLSTSNPKFGSSCTILDGTGDFWSCTAFTQMNKEGGSWTVELWPRWVTLPAGSDQFIFGAQNAATVGLAIGLNDTAGTKKLKLFGSSDGTTHDLFAGILGTSTTWATATYYHIAVVYDALAGKYFVYKDGVAEAALTTTSTKKICGLTSFQIGRYNGSAGDMNGNVGAFKFTPACLYPNGTTFTPPAVAPTVADQKYNFFNLNEYKMYEVTTASIVAGNNPGMTQKTRLCQWEVDAGGVSISAVRNYAYNGKYTSSDMPITINTITIINHNIGNIPKYSKLYLVNKTSDEGYNPGDLTEVMSAFDGTYRIHNLIHSSRTISKYIQGTGVQVLSNGTTAADGGSLVTTKWAIRAEFDRGF